MTEPKREPVALRPAATVLLLREGAAGVEVFMVVRHHEIDFASGALVFPGGKVEEHDSAPALAPHCRASGELDATALGLRVGAIREAFEESGVLLARPRGEAEFLSAERLRALSGWRDKLNENASTMLEIVEAENLELALDALVPFAHWKTPEFMPKRFDTYFFVAGAPSGQEAIHDGGESVDSVWIQPQTALKEADAGKRTIIFPTRMNVEKLAKHSTLPEALTPQPIVTVLPWLEKDGEDTVLRIQPDAGYGDPREKMPPRKPKDKNKT